MSNDRFDIKRPGVWNTKLTETVSATGEGAMLMISSRPQQPVTVRVDQTPDEARCTRNSNYPRYDWLDVHNLPNRKRV